MICAVELFALCACNSNNNQIAIKESDCEIADAPSVTICKLNDGSISKVGDIESFAIVDDTCFVAITDKAHVVLFNNKGEQVRAIGHSGRSENEYLMPTVVRACGGDIYVWSSFSLSFLIYSSNGEFVKSYKYDSAIRDFVPYDDKLIIYTAGKNNEYLIEILDLNQNCVTKKLLTASSSHKMLAHTKSVAPIVVYDGKLMFMPYDKQVINCFNIMDMNSDHTELAEFVSPSFVVDKITESDSRKEYLRNNSMNFFLFKNKRKYYFLSKEGKYVKDKKNARYYSLYETNLYRGSLIHKYDIMSLASQYLFNIYDSKVYFISHELNENDDVYCLKILDLS